MKLLHISDTHGKHAELNELPEADIVVHSGDFTFGGSEKEALDFINWFCDLPHKHKIFIAGNHDLCLYGERVEGLPDNVHFLYNSSVTIEGIKFFGVPLFINDVMKNVDLNHIKAIPSDVNILITHQPPKDILDFAKVHWGSPLLKEKVLKIKPAYHLFGHIHDGYGVKKEKNIVFSNACLVDDHYNLINPPSLFELKLH